MSDCIFCKIVEGQIPCYKVYEDNDVMAFLDINPVNPGHTLVIPKKHFSNLEETSEDDLTKVMLVVKKVGAKIKNDLGMAGYNVCENNDPVAGQEIPHIHFHVIPRINNDGHKIWKQSTYQDGEAERVLEKIKLN